jgi:hypothetical protein
MALYKEDASYLRLLDCGITCQILKHGLFAACTHAMGLGNLTRLSVLLLDNRTSYNSRFWLLCT